MRRLSDVVKQKNALLLPKSLPVTEACRKMAQAKADAALVVDERNRLMGIFTERDATHRVIASGTDAQAALLEQVMTANPVTLPADKDAIEALRVMWDCGFRHVLVMDRDQVLGVASREDFENDEQQLLEREREFWEGMR